MMLTSGVPVNSAHSINLTKKETVRDALSLDRFSSVSVILVLFP